KAAQLVRSCRALKETCLAYEIPLLSGKDSMYVDGHLPGRYGETHKVSALETMQFSAISVVEDIGRCITMDVKAPGDLVYVLGITHNELGGSEYYAHLGYTGLNVPHVRPAEFMMLYQALALAIHQGIVASAHGIYAGGLGVHLALNAMGGGLGLSVDLSRLPVTDVDRDDQVLFSESAGRFIVSVDPRHRSAFETLFNGLPFAAIGQVEEKPDLIIRGMNGDSILNVSVQRLKAAWQQPFGDLS
ncbi:MAG: AIR synthase-related protein, partial [Thermodesulfobacteriota bacterium]|nr:AIR synthase-related protein [Thermodesulfobacteriota bacterium]